jgi:hypothetical protein
MHPLHLQACRSGRMPGQPGTTGCSNEHPLCTRLPIYMHAHDQPFPNWDRALSRAHAWKWTAINYLRAGAYDARNRIAVAQNIVLTGCEQAFHSPGEGRALRNHSPSAIGPTPEEPEFLAFPGTFWRLATLQTMKETSGAAKLGESGADNDQRRSLDAGISGRIARSV